MNQPTHTHTGNDSADHAANHSSDSATAAAGWSRRQFLRNGSLAISFGAVLAACGTGRNGPQEAGRIGLAPPPATLPSVEINDVVLLRTAQSIEHSLLETYSQLNLDDLPGVGPRLAERLVADHTAHAKAIGKLIEANGGDQFTCANPFVMDRVVNPILEAYSTSDDPARDVAGIVAAFETWAAETYQAITEQLSDPALRTPAMTIGADENRHAAAMGYLLNKNEPFGPGVFGKPVDKNEAGFYTVYAVPTTFGALSAVNLVVGNVNADGVRYAALLQTPADNTFVYEGMTCDGA